MTEEQAKQRFFMLAAIRFGGVAVALTGITILARRWVEPAEVVGCALIAVGIMLVIVAPPVLLRAWKNAEPK